MQIVNGLGDVLVGVQGDSGELFEFEAIGGHQECLWQKTSIGSHRIVGYQRVAVLADHDRIDDEGKVKALSGLMDRVEAILRGQATTAPGGVANL
jgi:hypothetical protein